MSTTMIVCFFCARAPTTRFVYPFSFICVWCGSQYSDDGGSKSIARGLFKSYNCYSLTQISFTQTSCLCCSWLTTWQMNWLTNDLRLKNENKPKHLTRCRFRCVLIWQFSRRNVWNERKFFGCTKCKLSSTLNGTPAFGTHPKIITKKILTLYDLERAQRQIWKPIEDHIFAQKQWKKQITFGQTSIGNFLVLLHENFVIG